jgi:hypothetical protein
MLCQCYDVQNVDQPITSKNFDLTKTSILFDKSFDLTKNNLSSDKSFDLTKNSKLSVPGMFLANRPTSTYLPTQITLNTFMK